MELTQIEQRIIGCLLEKQTTTPEHYPLSLNALTNACNQKSNREPVLSVTESEVLDTLASLEEKRIVMTDPMLSGRVNKYTHRFCNTEFSSLQFSDQERAIICLLLLRGPQTPGELRTRSNRLAEFAHVQEVELALEHLQTNHYVQKLAKEPGKRESRYQHLFSSNTHDDVIPTTSSPDNKTAQEVNIAHLEAQIKELKEELAFIKSHLGL